MIDAKQMAASTLEVLQSAPEKYVNFGMYWYFIKSLLKNYYTIDNLYMLGNFEDSEVVARMPKYETLQDALLAAADEYQKNASFNLGSNVVTDSDGEEFILIDQDA